MVAITSIRISCPIGTPIFSSHEIMFSSQLDTVAVLKNKLFELGHKDAIKNLLSAPFLSGVIPMICCQSSFILFILIVNESPQCFCNFILSNNSKFGVALNSVLILYDPKMSVAAPSIKVRWFML